MQELRLVAVSEDGSYLVLATAGRGTRFTLPVDDRLRAAVRGHFSRLGQFEIEVESPLRPKEIQARIRAGETAEEIAETAGIPVERVRWFEGPVLQEREYMAQQAQRVVVRRQGETSPGPPLGEIVTDRLGRRGVDLEEVEWDSWKCEDSTWRVRLSFFLDGRPYAAEWMFDPRRRHVSALDEEAARLSSLELDSAAADTVTPFMPRRAAMKIVSTLPEETATASGPPRPPAPPVREPVAAPEAEPVAAESAPPPADDLEELLSATQGGAEAEPRDDEEAREETAYEQRSSTMERPSASPLTTPPAAEPAERSAAERPAAERPAAERPTTERPAAERPAAERPAERPEQPRPAEPAAEEVPAEHVAAAANGGAVPAAKTTSSPPTQPNRQRRKASARGKRASVPSWDEIMFGARRPD
ncbi:MAG TPA: septation protein SepH [Streptosporangiaceae bacterium]|nr:septation protein SepH [Streptosporangiaceae bacterium]